MNEAEQWQRWAARHVIVPGFRNFSWAEHDVVIEGTDEVVVKNLTEELAEEIVAAHNNQSALQATIAEAEQRIEVAEVAVEENIRLEAALDEAKKALRIIAGGGLNADLTAKNALARIVALSIHRRR
jgi:hypothetical protein